jgi:hypothetical protein
VPDASGLFNLMRNLGGAIGLALIDTVIYTRSPVHGAAILGRLEAGDAAAAEFIGIPAGMFAARPIGPLDGAAHAMIQPLIEKAALVQAINEAWTMIAMLTVVALLCVPFARGAPETRSAREEEHEREILGRLRPDRSPKDSVSRRHWSVATKAHRDAVIKNRNPYPD